MRPQWCGPSGADGQRASTSPATAASKLKAVGKPAEANGNQRGYRWWVLAAAPDYSWAVIGDGLPNPNGDNNGCAPKAPTFFGAGGAMVVSRVPDDAGALAKARAALSTLRWELLTPVQQAGCTYPQPFANLCPARF